MTEDSYEIDCELSSYKVRVYIPVYDVYLFKFDYLNKRHIYEFKIQELGTPDHKKVYSDFFDILSQIIHKVGINSAQKYAVWYRSDWYLSKYMNEFEIYSKTIKLIVCKFIISENLKSDIDFFEIDKTINIKPN